MSERKIIYDFGANTGDDLEYYLWKAHAVVAVEANKELCDAMTRRFEPFVADRRLTVINCVVTPSANEGTVAFFIHKADLARRTFVPPCDLTRYDYNSVQLPALEITHILAKYGKPYYIKLDVEGLDAALLRSLFAAGIFPEYVSAEAQSFEVLMVLAELGNYRAFKLIDGPSVYRTYRNRRFTSQILNEEFSYSFPAGCAGPFGEDIDGHWMDVDETAVKLAVGGVGWRDVHATRGDVNTIRPNLSLFFVGRIMVSRLRRLFLWRCTQAAVRVLAWVRPSYSPRRNKLVACPLKEA